MPKFATLPQRCAHSLQIIALATAILLSACGESDNDNASSGANSSPPSTPTNPPTTYLVFTRAGNGGIISPSIRANEVSTVNLTVTPNARFSIAGVSGCNGALSGNIYTTGAINADCTVNALIKSHLDYRPVPVRPVPVTRQLPISTALSIALPSVQIALA